MNPRNIANFVGIIPDTDKIKYDFKEGSEESKNYMYGSLSVRRNYKKPDDQYYQNDLIPFRAFGKTASFMNQYIQRGDLVCVSGEIRIGENFEKEGKTIYGTPFLHVESITKIGGKDTNNSTENKPEPEKKKANPLLNRKRSVI